MGRLIRALSGWRGAAAVGVGGLAALTVYVIAQDVAAQDLVELVVLAGGIVLMGVAATVVLLRWSRGAPLGVQIAVVACVPLLAVLAGTGIGAKAMFISRHDLTAVVVLLLAAGTVACMSAVLLGSRVAGTSDDLRAAAQHLGEGRPLEAGARRPTGELARVREELQQASVRLEASRERERALEASRRELIAWVSHDLRTPLAGIRALAEALEDGVVDDDPAAMARYYRTLRAEADRLAGLVDDLFELSQAQAGVITLEWDRVSLGDLVSDAVAGVSPIARARRVRVEGELEADVPDVLASPPELLRALRNVLENAVRHSPTDGTVVVRAGRRDGDAFVSVRDHGGGIPEQALPRVFDVGYRADPARGRDGGAGLGLAIARELVEAHAGRLTVANENGGACFTLLLPADVDPQPAPV